MMTTFHFVFKAISVHCSDVHLYYPFLSLSLNPPVGMGNQYSFASLSYFKGKKYVPNILFRFYLFPFFHPSPSLPTLILWKNM